MILSFEEEFIGHEGAYLFDWSDAVELYQGIDVGLPWFGVCYCSVDCTDSLPCSLQRLFVL